MSCNIFVLSSSGIIERAKKGYIFNYRYYAYIYKLFIYFKNEQIVYEF